MGSRKTGGGVENVYAAAQKWVDCALRSDDSLFTPGTPIWTSQWLGELRTRFLNHPDDGRSRFDQKLKQQLADSRSEIYQLMGEVLYLHFLIVSSEGIGGIKPSTKRSGIDQVLEWSKQPVEFPSDLVNGLGPGIARPGVAFNTYRPYQVGFLIEFAEQWKELDSYELQRLLADPWAFKEFAMGIVPRSELLRNIGPDRYRIQREALLHLVFPDTFERMVSVVHKNSIANAPALVHLVTEPADDVDHRIQQIRKGLEKGSRRDFDFYDDVPIRIQWDPKFKPWDEFVKRAKDYVQTGQLESQEISYKLEIGQRLTAAREAVRSDAEDWADLVKRGIAGNLIHNVQQSRFRNWIDESPDDALNALQKIWTDDDLSISERISAFSNLFPPSITRTRGAGTRLNIISVLLMGLDIEKYPPFRVTKFDRAYERAGYNTRERDADEAALYDHALGFLDRFIEEAAERDLHLRHRLDAQSVVWIIVPDDEDSWDTTSDSDDDANEDGTGVSSQMEPDLPSLANELTLPVEFLEEIEALLSDKLQVIFQGPPGTGKTYVAQKLANHLAGSEDRVTLVQFHPSYAYEDFVQGFRPTLNNGQPGFELRNGPLLRAADKARNEAQAKHFLVIDEINRGNLARVFGELYFLLEYRDSEMDLQYSDEPFSLPDNLYIIGTMNTADRSIALVDLALRRRFYFVEFHPDDEPVKNVLRNWLSANAPGMEWVADVVDAANEKLRDDRHAAIGPSYFMKSGLDETAVKRIWKHSVLPYIEERLFGNEDRIAEFNLDVLRGTSTPTSQFEDDEEGSQNNESAE